MFSPQDTSMAWVVLNKNMLWSSATSAFNLTWRVSAGCVPSPPPGNGQRVGSELDSSPSATTAHPCELGDHPEPVSSSVTSDCGLGVTVKIRDVWEAPGTPYVPDTWEPVWFCCLFKCHLWDAALTSLDKTSLRFLSALVILYSTASLYYGLGCVATDWKHVHPTPPSWWQDLCPWSTFDSPVTGTVMSLNWALNWEDPGVLLNAVWGGKWQGQLKSICLKRIRRGSIWAIFVIVSLTHSRYSLNMSKELTDIALLSSRWQ